MKKHPACVGKCDKLESEERRIKITKKTEAEKGMWKLVDVWRVIADKVKGLSNREIQRRTGYDRAKISETWSRYKKQVAELGEEGADIKKIQDEMFADPEYKTPERKRTIDNSIENGFIFRSERAVQ